MSRPEDRGTQADVREMRTAASRLEASAQVDLERFERIRRRRTRVERYKVIAVAAAVAVAAAIIAARLTGLQAPVPASPVPPPRTQLIVFGRSSIGIDQQRSLFTATPEGTDERRLPVTYTDCGEWSPDGSTLHVTASEYPGAPLRPAVVHPDGSGFMLFDAGIPPDLQLGCGDWSPDGSHLVLEGFGASPSVNGIYAIDARDGSGLARLTSGTDVVPQYAPDGSEVVFQRTALHGTAHQDAAALFIVGVDGSGPRRITPWGAARSAGSWSPDGRIVFAGPGRSLWTVLPDGTGLERLPVELPGAPFQPRWSPDGSMITLGVRIGEQTDIITLAPDGSGLVRITETPSADEWWPDWIGG
jgi:WD40-like Beta Propeller Repeat